MKKLKLRCKNVSGSMGSRTMILKRYHAFWNYSAMNAKIRTLLRTIVLLVIITMSAGLNLCPAQGNDSLGGGKTRKQVLILYSQPLDFPATEMTAQGIREIFFNNSEFNILVFTEFLDLSRFRNSEQIRALADLLRLKYSNSRIDVIISVDSPAANFLIDHPLDVFPDTQIVMCSIPQALGKKIESLDLRKRATCVFEPSNGAQLIHAALSLFPGTTNAAFVAGAFENDELRGRDLKNSLEEFKGRLNLFDLSGLTKQQTMDRIRSLPADTIIFFSTFFVDADGISYVPRDVLKKISEESGHPIFGPYDSFMGHGIVGGPLISVRLQGKRAAEVALEIMQGADAGHIPFDPGFGTTVSQYDWRQLQRWDIPDGKLPPGSSVLFRKPTIWELYKVQAIIVIALIMFQSGLIMALFVNLQKRKRAEISLLNSRQDLRVLAGRLISSQEDELKKLAREFHDDIVQRLAAAAIETGTLQLKASESHDPNVERIRSVKEQLIALSEDVHAISREIHPSILKDLGLVRAINSLCVMFSDRENIPVEIHGDEVPDTISKDVSLCFYRVIQESLRNIAKHAKAKHVTISLKVVGPEIFLAITDDGVGFVPQTVRQTPGIGLASMRERVDYINGTLKIISEPGGGSRIELSAPLEGGSR